jgi:hypothetical protein
VPALRGHSKLADILANAITPGEMPPATSRTMQFRVTARDNRAGGGGVNTADMQLTVVTKWRSVRSHHAEQRGGLGGPADRRLESCGSVSAPINATNVNILLSTNGGLNFSFVLATNTPNDGSESVILPSITSSNARVKVEAAGNIFFSVCRSNLSSSRRRRRLR